MLHKSHTLHISHILHILHLMVPIESKCWVIPHFCTDKPRRLLNRAEVKTLIQSLLIIFAFAPWFRRSVAS